MPRLGLAAALTDQASRYSFQPLERRGVLMGLEVGQLAVIVVGCVAAVVVRTLLGGAVGLLAAALTAGGAAGSALWKREGLSVSAWAGLGALWLARVAGGRVALSGLPLEGSPSRNARVLAPRGVSLSEDPGMPGDEPLAVIRDRRSGTWAGVVAVRGRPHSLLDPVDQAVRLELWRGVLGALARPGSSVRRVQWVERSGPAPVDDLYRSLRRLEGPDPRLPAGPAALADQAGPAGPAPLDSYRELLDSSVPMLNGHGAWLLLAIEPRRQVSAVGTRGRKRPGGSTAGIQDLRRELRLLDGHLRAADLEGGRPLDLAELAGLFESSREARRPRPRSSPGAAWSLAQAEHWDRVQSDGAWHATYWISEWPRVEVGPDFLMPLLSGSGRRTVSLVMAPVPAEQAMRQVRSSLTADLADTELREKAGFLPSARRVRESEGAARREAELADGHCEYRFSGYVTVTAKDADGLEAACAEAEHAAQGGHLELRRLYGRQAEALTWTLPLGRGLR